MTTAIRPDGRVYAPRKPAALTSAEDEHGITSWVIVLRTHDREIAYRLAAPELADLGWRYGPGDGELRWLREVPWCEDGYHDWSYIDDPVRGVPCVVWSEP